MADTAYQVLYRDEWIHGFERNQALLRNTVTTQTMTMERGARQAVFLVATSAREAVTRGPNGLIPSDTDDLVQSTVTLAEYHDLPQKTGFNIFAGQSDQRAIMQVTSRSVINRHIDDIIIDALETGTVDANSTAETMTKGLINHATTLLWNAQVQNDGNVFGLLTPAAWAYLSDIPQFTSGDYVNGRPLVQGAPSSIGGVRMVDWLGVKWIMHTGLPAMGTAAAKCFIYHKSAVGHAYNDIQALAGYQEEQDYSWARTTIYDGALKIQNSGIVVMTHNDLALSSST